MKKLLFIIPLALLLSLGVRSQHIVYFLNGNNIEAQLAEATGEKLKLSVMRGQSAVKYSHPRSKVGLAFNTNGNYLVVSELAQDDAQAQQQITDFLNAPDRQVPYDLIITREPKVIRAKISYESDDATNYQTLGGEAASLNKKDIVAIIYEDGRHQFVQPLDEATAALMASTHNEVRQAETAPPPPPVAAPAAIPQVEPAPVAADNTAPAAEPPAKTAEKPKSKSRAKPKPVLNDEEYKSYSEKALTKVGEFGAYLGIIVDKTKDADEKDKAIEQAAKLFMPDATIEVSSLNKPGTTKYKVKDYLTRLKLLPYGSASIEWTEIQYINGLTQAADGNYYGLIKGQQTFMGYDDAKNPVYSDVTQKEVKVKLQSYQKLIEGTEQVNWEVLLGNVGVSLNK
ncbi:MAG: hypothetical protein EAZ70_07850 [Runella slithyformis]|nr:MAG: hypothetical protein EAY79_07395 [Runella slithyformis]TAF27103.1 MAG: hypothetical protein EAZ70_07850 [Runella slithyformis]TAF45528.1 MAG: hypothetical protein EAZ63_10845 [Runella slithyformis]TAF80284.1 MAG: hypothetical protein EAZ50_09195 [Runella slithyformis]